MEEQEEDFEDDLEEEFKEDLEAPRPREGRRVIVHLDLDCFYAQVETLRNPQLKGKPVGVQQKSLVVTCNYEARKFGVGKLMDVRNALEKCPELVLVKGEDLTPYREMSYKVTELLREFCPLVERLGLDENFVDITELVRKKFQELEKRDHSQIQVCGHVYNNQGINQQDPRHLELLLGSWVAQEFRHSLELRLGLTGCAGIASNKLLAKLVSGTFKPNQQTLLLPETHPGLLASLGHPHSIPGIGSKTSKRLEVLGVKKVKELQDFPAALLEKEFGISKARRIQKLSRGEDETPVVPSGPPQSFSDEDSFKNCSTESQAKEKLRELLPNLLTRIAKDGRHPHTLRLGIRRFSRRECRQCPIPAPLSARIGKGDPAVIPPLLDILMKLLGKIIPLEFPFHLTLLSISFSNLKAIPSRKESIGIFLKEGAPSTSGKHPWDGNGEQREGNSLWNPNKTRRIPEENAGRKAGIPEFPPPFGATSKEKEPGIVFPPDVDPKVFQELPLEVQKELLAEWEKREVGARNSLEKSLGKPRRRKNSGGFSQSNNLLRYFKPQ